MTGKSYRNGHESNIEKTHIMVFQEIPLELQFGPAIARQHTAGKIYLNKRIIYWWRKEGEEEWMDEKRGNTVQRHLRSV